MKERNLVPAGVVHDQSWAVRYLDLGRGLRTRWLATGPLRGPGP